MQACAARPFAFTAGGELEPVEARRAFHLALIDAWDNVEDIAERICKEIGGDCRTLVFVRYIEFLSRPIGDKLQVHLITEWKCIVADSNGGGGGAILDGDIPKPECGALHVWLDEDENKLVST